MSYLVFGLVKESSIVNLLGEESVEGRNLKPTEMENTTRRAVQTLRGGGIQT